MPATIIDFIEDSQLLNDMSLSVAQKMSLKAVYGLALTADEFKIWQQTTGILKYSPRERSEVTFILGRRAGKSDKLATNIALYEACAREHEFSTGEFGVVMLCASEKKRQARILHDYCIGKLERSPVLRKLIEKVLVDEIRLTNNVRLQIYPASVARVRSPSLICFIGDEVAFWKSMEDQHMDLDREVLNSARPALNFPYSKLVKISTPYMMRGELWDDFNKFYGVDDDVLVFKGSSTLFNPSLTKAWENRLMRRDHTAYQTEVHAEFRADLSVMFLPERIEEAINKDRPAEIPYNADNEYIAFVDVSGGGGRDSYAVAIGHREDERIIIDAVRSRKPQFNPEEVTGDFAKLVKSYNIQEVTGDKFSGDWSLHSWAKRDIAYIRSLKSKSEIYVESESAFNTATVEIPDRELLIRQLQGLLRRTRSGGKDSVDCPSGIPDDESNVICGIIQLFSGESEFQRDIIVF